MLVHGKLDVGYLMPCFGFKFDDGPIVPVLSANLVSIYAATAEAGQAPTVIRYYYDEEIVASKLAICESHFVDGPTAPEHPFETIRKMQGWSYQRASQVVASRARELGTFTMAAERQKVWRWVHRGVVPESVAQRALAAELGVPDSVIKNRPWPGWLPALVVGQRVVRVVGLLDGIDAPVRCALLIENSRIVGGWIQLPD